MSVCLLVVTLLARCTHGLHPDAYPWENFRNKYGDVIDRHKLLPLHALMCPITKPCGEVNYYRFDYRWPEKDTQKYRSCKHCQCEDECLTFGNCCPDLAVSYMKHSCVDTMLYRSPNSMGIPDFQEVHPERTDPEKDDLISGFEKRGNYLLQENPWNLMVSACPEGSDEDVRLLCTAGNTLPVSGNPSNISYRNKHCAKCNHDDADLVDWQVKFVCSDNFPNLEDKPSKTNLELKMKAGECTVKYDSAVSKDSPPVYYCNYVHHYMYKIGRCNVTGLWDEYDADIEWACEHLHLTYKWRFKNVFCYICNPSIVSKNSDLVYDRCNITGRWKAFDSSLEKGCLTYPRIQRLSPFKNVYCILCNGYLRINRHDMLVNNGNIEIDELYFTESRPVPPISVVLSLKGTNIEERSRETFNVLTADFDSYDYEIEREETLTEGSDVKINVTAQANAYFKACGYQKLCEPDVYSPEVNDSTNKYTRYPYCEDCSCHSTCAGLGDCCVDKILSDNPYTCIREPRLLIVDNSTLDFVADKDNSMPVIDKCINRSDSELVERCETDHYNRSDVWQYLPVYNSGIYKNIFCLVCNEPNLEPVFKLSIHCQHYFETALLKNLSSLLKLAKEHCLVQIFPNNYNRYCGTVDSTDNTENLITSCNKTGLWQQYDETIANGCENTASSPVNFLPIFAIKFTELMYYKNYFCFICNPETVISEVTEFFDTCNITGEWETFDNYLLLSCEKTDFIQAWLPYKNVYCYLCNGGDSPRRYEGSDDSDQWTQPFMDTIMDPALGSTYRMLFSLTPEEWQRLYPFGDDPNAVCPTGQTFDYETNSCRTVYCSEQVILISDMCIPISTVVPTGEGKHYLSLKILPLEIGREYESGNNRNVLYVFGHPTSKVYMSLKFLCNKTASDVEMKLRKKGYDVSCTVCKPVMPKSCDQDFENRDIDKPIALMVEGERVFLQLDLSYYGNAKRNAINQALAKIYKDIFIKFIEFEIDFSFQMSVEKTSYELEREVACATEVRYALPLQDDQSPTIDTEGTGQKNKIDTCLQIQLGVDEFFFNRTMNSVYIRNRNKVLVEGEFILIDATTVRVCKSDYIIESTKVLTHIELTPFHKAHNIFSYVFTIISLVCVLLTFVTYCILPQLRTVPGRNIMSLCASLFVAQGSLQFSSFILTHEIICVPFAMLTHYSWLATFCAMNVCSFHMYRVFYFKVMASSEASVSFEHTRRYLLYTYSFPLLIVGLTTAIHLGLSKGSFTGYGKFACFLSDIYSVTFSFIVPAALIFVSNFGFFAVAFHAIRTSPRVGSNKKDRREFFVYLKLCTLTGVSWPLQIIDGFLPLTAFSFFVVFVNALQGLYIFVSYVCNERVFRLLSHMCAGNKEFSASKISMTMSKPNTQSTRLKTRVY